MYEFEVPQLVLTSVVNNNTENRKGEVILDWSTYDVDDKYFVIYRKEVNSKDWEKIVSLEHKLAGSRYVDILGMDINIPSVLNINLDSIEQNNNIQINASAIDGGTSYMYYIEAYDSTNTAILLSRSEEK